ncbi:MAG: hypothetical protein EPO28_11915 [Saprospiraceae bacterium]|nr:MAG: hypothetical protein EPO28_11915 [Saprospiraceae bacterium]
MKKVNFKKILMALTVAVAFLFAGMNTVQAQQASLIGGPLVLPAQVNYANSDLAVQVLDAKIAEIIAQLKQLTPGSPVFNALNLQYVFYLQIKETIESGETVPQSIINGVLFVMSDNYGATKQQGIQLRDDAIVLLSD